MRRRFKPGQHHKTGGFTRAGRPQHCEKFALGHLKIQVFDDECFPVIAFLHALKRDKRIAALRFGQRHLPVSSCHGWPAIHAN